jgi:hypothetical protein
MGMLDSVKLRITLFVYNIESPSIFCTLVSQLEEVAQVAKFAVRS